MHTRINDAFLLIMEYRLNRTLILQMAVTSLIVVTLCLAAGQVTSAATDKKTSKFKP